MPPKKQASESSARRQSEQSKGGYEDQIERVFLRRFGLQGAQFLRILRREFGGLDSLPADAVNRIQGLWTNIAFNNVGAGKSELVNLFVAALRAGEADLQDEFARSIGINTRNRIQARRLGRMFPRGMWNVPQKLALEHYNRHAGRLITNIDETTRHQINNIVRNALSEGTSYTEVERQLIKKFPGLGERKPQGHVRTRARLIALTESGQAYEGGKQQLANRAEQAGVKFNKHWLSVRDAKVSPGCKRNDDEGWIPNDTAFPSGHQRPLRFPGCRCTLQRRVARLPARAQQGAGVRRAG